nr:hypothetical protein [uncultured Desulfobulbus sp.]
MPSRIAGKQQVYRTYIVLLFCMLCWGSAGSAATYYVSSAVGNDDNSGTAPDTPLQTIHAVNTLTLAPGDTVRFRNGDVWQEEMLKITHSGTSDSPITYGSYSQGSSVAPCISGSRPIVGWTEYAANIYMAELSTGVNAGNFPYGINQLFNGDRRLPMGRWPNIEANDDGGYSTIDAAAATNQLTDNELPPVDWTGGITHIKGMRWYILNREIASSSGTTLHLTNAAECWNSSCSGWGYFINNHLNTLDTEGEWFYDGSTSRVYLYSSLGTPANGALEGSVVMTDDDRSWGLVLLGQDLADHVHDVVIENLQLKNGYRHGIATPTNYRNYEPSNITIQNNTIKDVDGIGINLAAWVYSALDGADGWRGGHNMHVLSNLIDGANHMGLNLYAKNSTISHNTIQNIGLVANLNASGLGCGEGSRGSCTESGDGVRIKTGNSDDSGYGNVFSNNVLHKIAYNGVDVFGHSNTLSANIITQACYTKGDCGGVRTYGSGSLSTTPVYDLILEHNFITDTIGNTDGALTTYDPLFGMGLYIDHYSRDVIATNNTIINATFHGILYQNSTGSIRENTLYNNASGTMYAGQVYFSGSDTLISDLEGNVLYGLQENAWTMGMSSQSQLAASENNVFFNPYQANHIYAGSVMTFAGWQNMSGMDAQSSTNCGLASAVTNHLVRWS